jgi:hypothetical protein|tara:strand:+ start:2067 stop:2447 length:381 start_codon:yes stop_codon:yes gene_type:complete
MTKKRGNPALVKGGPSLNPNGRPKGTKNKLTLLQNELIDQFAGEMNKEFKAVIRKVVQEAKGGDMTAARLLLERAIPARKAVEHYGAQEAGGIVINIKGLEDINVEENETVDADFTEVDQYERSTM